jgi:hypothetical protein
VVVEVEVELDVVETAASETDATVVDEEGGIVAMAFWPCAIVVTVESPPLPPEPLPDPPPTTVVDVPDGTVVVVLVDVVDVVLVVVVVVVAVDGSQSPVAALPFAPRFTAM